MAMCQALLDMFTCIIILITIIILKIIYPHEYCKKYMYYYFQLKLKKPKYMEF